MEKSPQQEKEARTGGGHHLSKAGEAAYCLAHRWLRLRGQEAQGHLAPAMIPQKQFVRPQVLRLWPLELAVTYWGFVKCVFQFVSLKRWSIAFVFGNLSHSLVH